MILVCSKGKPISVGEKSLVSIGHGSAVPDAEHDKALCLELNEFPRTGGPFQSWNQQRGPFQRA